MRGCACRGDSAGFVHLECLTKLAMSKEASGDIDAAFAGWLKCGNCKQDFQGALELEMKRRSWRRHRSSHDVERHYNSTKCLALCLGDHGECDAANQVLDEASNCTGNNKAVLLELKLVRSRLLMKNGQMLEALGLMQATLPEAKVYTARPHHLFNLMHQITEVLLNLGRYQEAYEAGAETVAIANANYSMEDPVTLTSMTMYATACALIARVEEAQAIFEDALTTQIRVFGPEHPQTEQTRQCMRFYGFA